MARFFIGLVAQASAVHCRRRIWTSILRQDVGFFDEGVLETGGESGGGGASSALVTRLGRDVEILEAGLGEKVSVFVMQLGQIATALILAFFFSWKLTLVLLSVSPVLVLGAWGQGELIRRGLERERVASQDALGFAMEVIAAFRIVASFAWESVANATYNTKIDQTKKSRNMALLMQALGGGLAMFFVFSLYALGFWYGAQLVADGPANGGILLGDMLIVFFSIIAAAMGFAQLLTALPAFAMARAAAFSIMQVVDRIPSIDAKIGTGVSGISLEGKIDLEQVRFAFPSRPHEEVLKGVSLSIPRGSIVGIVGASGSGKSTVIQLLERFYAVQSGSIKIDGVSLQDFDLQWLRQNIGLVSQEPRLFNMSIEENILVGKPGASHEEVVQAATAANCHSFIIALKNGYSTLVGEGGSQLSGGQKQRVAIARAFIKDPKILLLDEATSALDTASEAVVQIALDRLMQGRTTIQIAHRLSTIRKCDLICVMSAGQFVETGTHAELLKMGGHYYALASVQMEPEDLVNLHQSGMIPKQHIQEEVINAIVNNNNKLKMSQKEDRVDDGDDDHGIDPNAEDL